MSIVTARSIEYFEAQQAIKKVEEHLIDEDIEKIVEGDEEINADKFLDDMVKATLKVVVHEMVNETTNKNMRDNLSMVVKEAIKLEKEKTKVDIALMVADAVDAFLKNYMNNHILHDDEQARDPDLPIWLALKYKFEKPAPNVDPCRVDGFHGRDQEDYHDNYPEGEISAKRQRMYEHGTYTRGTDDDEIPSKEVARTLVEVYRKGITTYDLQ
uniref:Uncharacterized protein n=1 Tax=Tanacetum cinerariifolium TaxID=118510 RepID=A0A6L2NI95_TANCI|nr:hypothetical protein [Tanacetum cinerariifolium]